MSERQWTMRELAELTGARLALPESEARGGITGVAAIGNADRASLVFAEDDGNLRAAVTSPAGAILARHAPPEAAADSRVLVAVDPRYAFAVCARAFAAQIDDSVIDPAASVHPSAQMGARVRVGAGAVIEAGARLGDDVQIGSNAVVHEGVEIGHRVVVQAGAVLGSRGFGYVRHRETGEYLLFPQVGTLVVEDDVEVGANTTIDRGALEETRIGRGTKIDNLVHVGHNCRIGKNVIIAAQVGISGSCVVEDGAVLAGQVGISDHCHIGPGVILGGQAGVYRGKTVTGPGEVFAGTPAEPLREQMRALARLRRLR